MSIDDASERGSARIGGEWRAKRSPLAIAENSVSRTPGIGGTRRFQPCTT